MNNYFNQLSFRQKTMQLGKCDFLSIDEFKNGVTILKNKKIVILGCGAQGLNQGLNMRDSGLDISYALRESSIKNQNSSWKNATSNNFTVGTFEELIPTADLVLNLTPDKQHTPVINHVLPLMKKNAFLSYSHGFNIVEEGMQIRNDITVIMVAPKSPGSEVRKEYLNGFGVPTLIAVHAENDPLGLGLDYAKAYTVALGGHRAGVLLSSFVAEVKSDLMGEQTILCGVLQTASILCFNKMLKSDIKPSFAAGLIQYGWETITEALKLGGITNMMDRLSNPSKIKAYEIAEELKVLMTPLFIKHMDDILSGNFSNGMMQDWVNNDENLLTWRKTTSETEFEKSESTSLENEQDYFDYGLLLVAFVKAGVELAFEIMVESGIKEESAYYESLHELPLIANTIARKKLYEMNKIISDTAEYGCYLFDHACKDVLSEFIENCAEDTIGKNYYLSDSRPYSNTDLIEINDKIRQHPIEKIGKILRDKMIFSN